MSTWPLCPLVYEINTWGWLLELGRKIGPSAQKAIEAYRAANNGQMPPNEHALLPFFATSSDGADFVEFLVAQKKAEAN